MSDKASLRFPSGDNTYKETKFSHVVQSNMFLLGYNPFLAGQILTVVTLATVKN